MNLPAPIYRACALHRSHKNGRTVVQIEKPVRARVDAIRSTVADTQEDMTDMAADEAMTRDALELLGSKRNDAYEAALAVLREDTRALASTRRDSEAVHV